MYPIWHNSRQKGHDFNSFMSLATKICENHQNEGRASAFAFILYDEFNPEIRNLLYDETYWNSLHEISGTNITIFSIKVKERRRVRARSSTSTNRPMEYMTALHAAKSLRSSNNEILSNLFKKDENVQLPGLMFFQIQDRSIIDNFYIELKERNKEAAFNEIKDYLLRCAKTISFITDENKGNYKEIFNLIKEDVKYLNTKKSIFKTIPAIRTLSQFIGLIS